MSDQLYMDQNGELVPVPVSWDGEPLWSPSTVAEGLFEGSAFEQIPGQVSFDAEEKDWADGPCVVCGEPIHTHWLGSCPDVSAGQAPPVAISCAMELRFHREPSDVDVALLAAIGQSNVDVRPGAEAEELTAVSVERQVRPFPLARRSGPYPLPDPAVDWDAEFLIAAVESLAGVTVAGVQAPDAQLDWSWPMRRGEVVAQPTDSAVQQLRERSASERH